MTLHNIDVKELDRDVKDFNTFNEFFSRPLKEGARPVTDPDNDKVIVSAADSRLMVFQSVEESTK